MRGKWRTLRLVLGRDELRTELWNRAGMEWSHAAAYRTPESLTDAVSQTIAALPSQAEALRAELRVARPMLQYRELPELPRLRAGAMRALVAHQSSRLFRQNGHPLITDAAWQAARPGSPGRVCAIAVEEYLIQVVLEELTRRGIVVRSVGPALEGPLASMTLWPRSAREAEAARDRRSLRRLAVATLIVWSVVGLAALGRLIHEQRNLEQDLASLAGPRATVSRVRRELAGAEQMLAGVDAGELDRTLIPRQLIALNHALPESAVVSALSLELDGAGSLGGSAPRALDVVAALDRHSAVVAPRLEGVPIKDPSQTPVRERFTILFGSQKLR